MVDLDRGRGAGAARLHPHLHGPADHGGHRQPEGAQAEEGRRVPPRPPHRHRPHSRLLHLRTSLVRGRHRALHQPRQVAHRRVGGE